MKYDVIVVGSGISGMRAAIEAKELGANVVLITKSSPSANNSFMAKGGINAAFGNMGDNDNIFQHINETLKSSVDIGNEESIRIFCEQAPTAVRELVGYGVAFSRLDNGKLAQRPFGGSKFKRTIYASDETGPAIMKALYDVIKENEIDIIKNHMVMNLITKNNIISGITLFDEETQKVVVCEGKSVILATGGFAALYKNYTSNVKDATGDGIAMGLRAGLKAMNLEFVQFHPTGLEGTNFLLSEAARAEGGKLVDENGESFVDELNTRDFVTRAIFKEMQKGNKVYLDLRDVAEDVIETKLTSIKKRVYTLKKLDPSKDLIPITPVAHYTMGGIQTDVIGKTSIKGLYIIGEAGDNGVNGANRLGGNSLSQGAVFGKISAYEAIKFANKMKKFNGVDYYDVTKDIHFVEYLQARAQYVDANALRNEIGQIMFEKIGIIRTEDDLNTALERFKQIEESIGTRKDDKPSNVKSMLELFNILLVAKAVAKSALLREESRGSHFRIDYPEKDRKFKTNTLVSLSDL
ncbi:MAG: FAD-dependent oxidoreductase [Sulfurospirillaceae bacterium]|nr:FAD-dependent oxidoreductase [Sulfurospirillaceae bacterium]